MFRPLKALWDYERMVHRQCIKDLSSVVNISTKKLVYSCFSLLVGTIVLLFFSGLNAVLDQIIFICGSVVGACVLFYGISRTLVPVKLMAAEVALRQRLEEEKTVLEQQLQPKLQIELSEDDPTFYHHSPFFDSEAPISEILQSPIQGRSIWRLCRISIKNLSKAYTIHNVEVKLTAVDKCPEALEGKLPLRLHFMHDNQIPFKHSMDINPGSRQFVDVISWSLDFETGPPKFVINHSEGGVDANIPVADYKLTIEVSAIDALVTSRQFGVGMRSKNGGLLIYMWPA